MGSESDCGGLQRGQEFWWGWGRAREPSCCWEGAGEDKVVDRRDRGGGAQKAERVGHQGATGQGVSAGMWWARTGRLIRSQAQHFLPTSGHGASSSLGLKSGNPFCLCAFLHLSPREDGGKEREH